MDTQSLARIHFEQIRFLPQDGVRGLFLGRYYFDIPAQDLLDIGEFFVENGDLVFEGIAQDHAEKKFSRLLDAAFERLYHINYNKPTVYIHSNSEIPLIGTNEFGLVDRGTNIIEVKPLTGCNFNCPYCSVDEGKNDKTHDYLVEMEYLVEEAAKIAKRKQHDVEFHIGPQGEPMLYPQFVELVRGLRAIPNCERITVVTNGSMLTEKLIDELADAGLTKINISLNAVTQETADLMSGRRYPLEHVLRMIKYAEGKIEVMIAPTIVPGFNDHEMDGLVALGKQSKSKVPIGMQNFLLYKRGRNPVKKERPFDEFFEMLKPLEEKHGVNLTKLSNEDLYIQDEVELEKPFKKNDMVEAVVVMPARYPGEIIAVAKERCITVSGHDAHLLSKGRRIKVKIVRDKHNIFRGVI